MVRKVDKNLSLDLDLVQQLEQEPNQSQLVNKLLRQHYDQEPE